MRMFRIASQDNIRVIVMKLKDHGRIEKRTYTTLLASEVFDEGKYSQWHGLRSLIQVEREISRLEGETRIDKQYYISSLYPESCQLIGQFI